MMQDVGKYSYAFYTANGRSLDERDRDYIDSTIDTFHTQGYEAEVETLKNFETEKSAVFIQQEARAREFMDIFEFTNLAPVHIVDDDPNDVFGFQDPATTIAMVPAHLDAIIFRQARLVETNMYKNPDQIAGTVVHEFSHLASPKEHIGIQADSVIRRGRDHGRSGFTVRSESTWEGVLFEEGFAEYMASRYIRMQRGDMRTIGIEGIPKAQIPDYLLPPEADMLSGLDGYIMELLAYGLAKKEVMSTDSFADLLLDTRRDTTHVGALRAFAQAVETIEPGLYMMLRRLEPDKTNWAIACSYVHSLVVKL